MAQTMTATVDAVEWGNYGKCGTCNAKAGAVCIDLRSTVHRNPRSKPHPDRPWKREYARTVARAAGKPTRGRRG